ncbi:unnamed protein product [Polarella glacialis]|uniref:carbonic anhydrase n=1 Tax=Polarella glacialis TaxID=89957 RepID=A0A813JX26_POLGL|nr:unnamed protein product [Polarella glacialis]
MPSEHFIDGKQYAAELQVVHFGQKYVAAIEGALEEEYPLVTALLFDIGEKSLLLKELYLPQQMIGMSYFLETKHPLDLMRSLGPALAGDFYRYDGSLTTPGCHEHTKWLVFAKTMTLTRTQWAAFKGMFPNLGNSRPLQPTNGRLLSRNSFEDGEPQKFDNYLGRHFGRDRLHPNTLWILVPIGVAILLAAVVMMATFVREGSRKLDQAGGLSEMTIGKGWGVGGHMADLGGEARWRTKFKEVLRPEILLDKEVLPMDWESAQGRHHRAIEHACGEVCLLEYIRVHHEELAPPAVKAFVKDYRAKGDRVKGCVGRHAPQAEVMELLKVGAKFLRFELA